MDLMAGAVEALAAALAGDDAERALARLLRANPLSSSERATLSRWVLGTSVLRANLAFRLQRADLPAAPADLIRAYRTVLAGEPLLELPEPRWPADPVERLTVEASLPRWLAELWVAEQGFERARSLALAMNAPGPTTLRANALKTTRDALAETLRAQNIHTEPGRRAPNALHVIGRANLWGSDAWRAGLFEVQDEGSQLIIEACGAKPGERWLDLCAGSGGKTLGLAAAGARVLACDVDGKKLENLAARVKRAGAPNVELRALEPEREHEALRGERFDGVLVDAPCSELGILRRHPDSRWRITPDSIAPLPALQKRLLAIAREHGARSVYATCTVRRAENEDVAGPGRQLRPDVEGTDAFFIA